MSGISSRWVTKIKRAGVEICESSKRDALWIICEQTYPELMTQLYEVSFTTVGLKGLVP
jgi:hypothetical protein